MNLIQEIDMITSAKNQRENTMQKVQELDKKTFVTKNKSVAKNKQDNVGI